MSDSLRIIFAGTPDFAARHLDALLSSGHNVVGVFTQPDRPAGRGKKLMPSPVKVLAEEKGIPVFQPASLRPQENQQLGAANGVVPAGEQLAQHGHVAQQRDAAGVVIDAVLHEAAEDGDLAAAQAQH